MKIFTITNEKLSIKGMKEAGPIWWHGKFRGCGYRMTSGREAVLGALSESTKHLSAGIRHAG